MFRKIVSNLPFSPALVGQLGFYAKRLKKEEVTRKLGLIFTALALAVQSFAVFSPPEAANASGYRDNSTNSIIKGGALSIGELRDKYNRNTPPDIHTIYDYYGLTSNVINGATVKLGTSMRDGRVIADGQVVATDNTSLGRRPVSGSSPLNIGGTTYYSSRSQTVFASNSIETFVFLDGNGKFIGGIMLACGNPVGGNPTYVPPAPPPPSAVCNSLSLTAADRTHFKLTASGSGANGATVSDMHFYVYDSSNTAVISIGGGGNPSSVNVEVAKEGSYTAKAYAITSVGNVTSADCAKQLVVTPKPPCSVNPAFPADSPECKPCPGDDKIWYKDKDCIPNISHKKISKNLTQGKDATASSALPGDKIQFTVSVKNDGLAPVTQDIADQLSDVLEYSTLIDTGGGTFDANAKTLTWPSVTVNQKSTQTRSFVVQVLGTIPTTNTGTVNTASYDCVMNNTFGNAVDVKVTCPPEKVVVENTVSELPHTGPGENFLFAGILLAVVVYFYARSRQLGKEVRLVRRNVNAGAI